MEKHIIKISEEQANYLQRLGIEVDSQSFLIDRMFVNHAMDEDTTVFDSIPFQHFMKKYEQTQMSWELAKQEFQRTYLDKEVAKITGKEQNNYNWIIKDYFSLECEVTLL